MDEDTKAQLQAIHYRTPRYLFRLWADGNEDGMPSGGNAKLNTATAITPLAFAQSKGHASAYDMTREEFADLAFCHLHLCKDIATEFSSWSASLNWILNKCPDVGSGGLLYEERDNEHLYLCVIDVEMLRDTNQAFYAPALDFLRPGQMDYPHEYLVHGVVQGPWYHCIRYSAILPIWQELLCPTWNFRDDAFPVQPLTAQVMNEARKIGELFGEKFCLGMTLAILCCQKHDPRCWEDGIFEDDIQVILGGVKDMKAPKRCRLKDASIGKTMKDSNFDDTWQMPRLWWYIVHEMHCDSICTCGVRQALRERDTKARTAEDRQTQQEPEGNASSHRNARGRNEA